MGRTMGWNRFPNPVPRFPLIDPSLSTFTCHPRDLRKGLTRHVLRAALTPFYIITSIRLNRILLFTLLYYRTLPLLRIIPAVLFNRGNRRGPTFALTRPSPIGLRRGAREPAKPALWLPRLCSILSNTLHPRSMSPSLPSAIPLPFTVICPLMLNYPPTPLVNPPEQSSNQGYSANLWSSAAVNFILPTLFPPSARLHTVLYHIPHPSHLSAFLGDIPHTHMH
jgi:hypothetical protein